MWSYLLVELDWHTELLLFLQCSQVQSLWPEIQSIKYCDFILKPVLQTLLTSGYLLFILENCNTAILIFQGSVCLLKLSRLSFQLVDNELPSSSSHHCHWVILNLVKLITTIWGRNTKDTGVSKLKNLTVKPWEDFWLGYCRFSYQNTLHTTSAQ